MEFCSLDGTEYGEYNGSAFVAILEKLYMQKAFFFGTESFECVPKATLLCLTCSAMTTKSGTESLAQILLKNTHLCSLFFSASDLHWIRCGTHEEYKAYTCKQT